MAQKVTMGISQEILKNVKGSAEMTDQQAEFLNNRRDAALQIGTTVVIPAQYAHLEEGSNNNGTFLSKAVFVNVYRGGEYLETKSIAVSQFQKRTYGPETTVAAITTVDGQGRDVTRGEYAATVTNVDAPLPVKAVDHNGKHIMTVVKPIAYRVERGSIHNVPTLFQEASGAWSLECEGEYLALKRQLLPELKAESVVPAQAVLPEEVKEFAYKG